MMGVGLTPAPGWDDVVEDEEVDEEVDDNRHCRVCRCGEGVDDDDGDRDGNNCD